MLKKGFKVGNKIDLVKFSSTKNHITDLTKVSELMLKISLAKIIGRGRRLVYWVVWHCIVSMVQSWTIYKCNIGIFLSSKTFLRMGGMFIVKWDLYKEMAYTYFCSSMLRMNCPKPELSQLTAKILQWEESAFYLTRQTIR